MNSTLAKEILNDHVKRNMGKTQKAVKQFKEDYDNLEDFLIPTNNLDFSYDATQNSINAAVPAKFAESHSLKMSYNAISQLSNRFDIPAKFTRDNMNGNERWRKEMISNVLQSHSDNIKNAFMFRKVNNEIRGVMSKNYKRFNSQELVNAFLKATRNIGFTEISLQYDGYNIMVESVYPEPFMINVGKKESWIMYGVKMRNSDFGTMSLNYESFLMDVICLNGVIGKKHIKKVHRGSSLGTNEQILSQETMNKVTEAEAAIINDAIKHFTSTEAIENAIENYKKIGTIEIDLDYEMKKLSKVVSKEQYNELDSLMKSRPEEANMNGSSNFYALIQGMTFMANSQESIKAKHDLQEHAGKLIEEKVEKK